MSNTADSLESRLAKDAAELLTEAEDNRRAIWVGLACFGAWVLVLAIEGLIYPSAGSGAYYVAVQISLATWGLVRLYNHLVRRFRAEVPRPEPILDTAPYLAENPPMRTGGGAEQPSHEPGVYPKRSE